MLLMVQIKHYFLGIVVQIGQLPEIEQGAKRLKRPGLAFRSLRDRRRPSLTPLCVCLCVPRVVIFLLLHLP